jgi:hypothetical protein
LRVWRVDPGYPIHGFNGFTHQTWYVFLFSFLSFNFSNFFLFHSFLILDWLGNEIHGFFLSSLYMVIMISNKHLFKDWCSILQVFNFIIKLKKIQNQKFIKFIEVHDLDRKVTEVDLIWHRLCTKKNCHLKFLIRVIFGLI